MIWMIWHKHRKHSTADKKGSFSLYLHAIGIENLWRFYKIFFLKANGCFSSLIIIRRKGGTLWMMTL